MIKMSRQKAAPTHGEPDDTRTRILDTAERLFAARGIDAVSVRSVLKEAGVSVALAHYHFGSREGLVEELLKSLVAPLVEEQMRALDAVDGSGPGATLEDVLRAYQAPLARWIVERPRFGRLFAQLQLSSNPEIRALGREVARKVLHRFADAAAKRLRVHVDAKRLLLRFYIVLGASSFLSAHWDALTQSARKRFGPDATIDAETLTEELVAFSAAGLRGAPAGKGG